MTTCADAKQITRHAADDWSAIYDGEYIGSFRTREAAQRALDDHALRLIEDGLVDLPLTTLAAPASHYTCLDCQKPLPAGRGGHCDSCVNWNS